MNKTSLALILSTFLFASTSAIAAPVGFGEDFVKPAAPNSIKGVLTNGRNQDYVLVRGIFVNKIQNNVFTFEDENGSKVRVIFDSTYEVPKDMTLNYEYFLWSRIQKTTSQTVFQAVFLSPKHH